MLTKHAAIRAQQRGIPPLVNELLDRYGAEAYDGHGGVTRYFNRQCEKRMERDLGKRVTSVVLDEYKYVYKVDTTDGTRTITTGHRTKSIKRK